MALKTIETKAIISAQDETGSTFAKVAEKLRQMETRADGATKKLQATTKAASTAQAAGPKAERASGLMAGIPSVVTAIIAAESVRALAEAIGARIHEGVRMEAAGMPAAEIESGKLLAASLAHRFPSIPQTDILHTYGTALATTGSAEDAAAAVKSLAPLSVILAQQPGGAAGASEQLDAIVKSAELRGISQDPEALKRFADAAARSAEVFQNVKPVELFETMRHARQAGLGLSEEFTSKILPTIIQEMGGPSTGTTLAAFNRAIVGGKMEHSALKRLADLGLVDKNDLDALKSTGEFKGLKPGAHIQGYKLAQENPYEWVQKYLLPALAKKGITEKEGILATVPELFSKSTAAQLVDLFATQQTKIGKDRGLLDRATGLRGAETYMQKDVGVQIEGVKNASMDLAETVGGNLATHTDALNKLSGALGAFNEKMTGAGPVASLAVAAGAATAALAAFTAVVTAGRWAIGGVTGAAAAAGVGARGLGAAAVGLFSPIPLALAGGALAASTTRLNAGEDERARQLKYGQGWLSNAPPGAGAFSPLAGGLGHFTELKGAADVTVKVGVDLSPGLVEKAVNQAIDARGNMRVGDTGVSMPTSLLPR